MLLWGFHHGSPSHYTAWPVKCQASGVKGLCPQRPSAPSGACWCLGKTGEICTGLDSEGTEPRVECKVGRGRIYQYKSPFCNSRVHILASTSEDSGNTLLGQLSKAWRKWWFTWDETEMPGRPQKTMEEAIKKLRKMGTLEWVCYHGRLETYQSNMFSRRAWRTLHSLKW